MDSDGSRSPEQNSLPGTGDSSGVPRSRFRRTLQREVLYPQRQNTGVGVMLVASAAMFFAVASSAFILRAKMPMPEACPHSGSNMSAHEMDGITIHRVQTLDVELIDLDEVDGAHAHATQCGEPVFQDSESGPSTVVFELCGPGAQTLP